MLVQGSRLPARPLRCWADALLTQSSMRRLMPLLASYLRSCTRALPRSLTAPAID